MMPLDIEHAESDEKDEESASYESNPNDSKSPKNADIEIKTPAEKRPPSNDSENLKIPNPFKPAKMMSLPKKHRV